MKTLTLASLIVISTAALADRPIPENEYITAMLGNSREVTTLSEIESAGLTQAKTTLDLWSGSYWPQYQGSLAVRYRDPSFQALMANKSQWLKFRELADALPLYTYSGNENNLSPAEKYDLLVGDREMSLTAYAWGLGEKDGRTGKVPTWRGICDGWASAAQKMPRPVRSVTLPSADGKLITFYPEDIKALGSLLYARAKKKVVFLGKRCNGALQGLFNGACLATNPGAFHKALINRVGVMKSTFNADLSTSAEVWNYPARSYKISYYNVLTGKTLTSYKEALEVFDRGNRKFEKVGKRHEATYAIVGVKVEVVFADMRSAHTLEFDGLAQDSDQVKTYKYDLEVDYNTNILGGEWDSKGPDFIWAPNDVAFPKSSAELKFTPVTASEITEAAQISSKLGQPLSVIVENLFTLSM